MEVIVGKLAGFCGGVINSVNKTHSILEEYGSTYCLGELVHNKQVVDKLKKMGLVVIDGLDDIPNGVNLIIRAHGVTKEIYKIAEDKSIHLFDLTCPKVLKIHEQAERYVNEGYFIVLVAQKNHPEAIGTISFCGKNSIILENEDELSSVFELVKNSGIKKVAIISQTTFSVKKFEQYVENLTNLLADSFELEINNTICSATELRQKETKEIAERVDAMVIIGGKNSSNTKKLYELALDDCRKTFIIETLEDLVEDMSEYNVIGVMAGASTPKESIEEVVEYLKSC